MENLEHFVANGGVRIHCLEFNPEDRRTPLIMVPGMGNAAEEIAETIGTLLERHTVILSLRGRGKSDSPETGWTVADQASDIAAVIRHFGFSKVFLFGHSTGASIAARSIPMLSDTLHGFVIGDFAPFYPPYDAGWRDHVIQFFPERRISDAALDGIIREAEYTDVSEYLNGISSKLLIITGDEDKSALQPGDIEMLQKLFPLIRVVHLKGSSHEFLTDDPKGSVEAIERFIVELESAE